jgi:conjugative relaxase-like TrwC/TraI family protein
MLNIGRLAPGAADYYIGEVATSAEDYYTGKGESHGRWVGSVADQFGLRGAVTPEAFRAVLDGRHPITGEQLARSRAGGQKRRTGNPNQAGLFDDDVLDTARVASRLRVTVGRVRQLATAGQRIGGLSTASHYLRGERVARPDKRGPTGWTFPRHEVERFEAEHRSMKARPGYDLTLRPPKSVSLLWALGSNEQRAAIRQAHAEAVDAVVDYMERHAVFARRGTGDRGRVEVDGVVGAAFDHRTSRAGDPLLHTHVVVANLTRTAEDRWQAIDGRGLYEHARPGGFLYQAHLRHLLTERLGVTWEPVHNGWAEISGVPRPVIRAFSKRRDEIEEMVAESGYTSARAHQTATLATRHAKEYGVAVDALDAKWQAEASELGFGADEVARCFDRTAEPERSVDLDTEFVALAGPLGLTRQASTFGRGEVVEAMSERLPACSATNIEHAVDSFLASSHVHPLARDRSVGESVTRRSGDRTRSGDFARYSTPDLLAIEHRLLAWSTDGFGGSTPGAHQSAVDAVLAQRTELSVEQEAMVRAVCSADAPAMQPVSGRPGAGKTYAMAAAVEAFTASGVPVVGCALSATAAAELEAATGLGEHSGREASTIARFLIEADHQGLAPGTVILIDEASMVGTRDLTRLAEHAARVGGALKLIGDPDQHGPVETGGVFRTIVAAQGDRLVELVENNRQIDEDDRASIDAYRQGLVESALSRYDAAGRIVRSPNAAASYDAIVSDWHDTVRVGGTDPMIAGPNRVRVALNDRARAHLIADGVITGEPLVAGDREYRVGEWVVARRNDRRLTGEHGSFVKNGSSGRIAAVDKRRRELTVDFNKEGRVVVPSEYLDAGWMDYGYARTTYGVQGATLDRAMYHAGDESSFEEGYVALTRGRVDTRIYLVDGTSPIDDETAHRAHDTEPTGLDTVSAAMECRRAKALAHDADPFADRVRTEFAGWDLARLHGERNRLEAVIDAAPPDVSEALVAAGRRHDALETQRRSWTERLAAAQPDSRSWRPGSRRTAVSASANATRELERVEGSLNGLDARIESLRGQWQARRSYFELHAGEVERLNVVRRAEQARELQVRTEAHIRPPTATIAALGPEPTVPAKRQAWLNAAETQAVHDERFGTEVDDADSRWSERVVKATVATAQAEVAGRVLVDAELGV